MYIAFVALYLLTCVNYEEFNKDFAFKTVEIEEKYRPIYANYTDLSKNAVDFNYCGLKTCLIKCCGDGEYLDDDGQCQEEQYFKDGITNELGFEYWNEIKSEIRDHMKRLSDNFVFILRAGNVTEPERNFTSDQSYVLEGGELYCILDNPMRVIEVWRLHYCADHMIHLINKEKKFKFVYDISEVHEILAESEENNQANEVHIEYYVLGGAMLFTCLSLAIIACRVPKLMKHSFMLSILLAYFFALICAYGLKHLQIALTNTENDNGCKAVSSALYTLLLSAFCWTLVLNYNSLKTLRDFRVTKKLKIEADVGIFFGYALFAWGLPLAMTLIALAIDNYDIGILKPPFDNCFTNEQQIMAYLHIPVSMLIIAQTTVFLIYAYDLWIVHMINDMSNEKRLRPFVFGKLASLLLKFIAIMITPNIPTVLFYVMCISITVIWFTYFFIFVCNIILICRRSSNTDNENYKEIHEDKSSTMSQNNDNIAIISNNELDKKKTLNFSYNIAMMKDHIMASIMPHDYEKLFNDLVTDNNVVTDNHDAEKNIGTDSNL